MGKTPSEKIRARLTEFMEKLHDRLHRILEVIDEGLEHEEFRHKVWAVDAILKRIKHDALAPFEAKKPKRKLKEQDLQKLTDDELMAEIGKIINPK